MNTVSMGQSKIIKDDLMTTINSREEGQKSILTNSTLEENAKKLKPQYHKHKAANSVVSIQHSNTRVNIHNKDLELSE